MSEFLEVLESYPYTAEGRVDAFAAAQKHAKTLVARRVVDRFSVGTKVTRDATTRGNVILVVLYARTDTPATAAAS